ncbi:putative heat shock protein family 70 protein [Triangularia verruculosa]|uniref:Heat shock protein family 70 protein n=1 Tax=Triangularia verruculosa TaxID=2587418 RepID=A0AAN6XAD4_9PEZI|nr:putative heat shock protein family 70 protein [Triangularia verruculosa]
MASSTPPPPTSDPPPPPPLQSGPTSEAFGQFTFTGLPPGLFSTKPTGPQRTSSPAAKPSSDPSTASAPSSYKLSTSAYVPHIQLRAPASAPPSSQWQPPGPTSFGPMPPLKAPSVGGQVHLQTQMGQVQRSFEGQLHLQGQKTPDVQAPPPVHPVQATAIPLGETRLQIALDYGTTYTGVAYLPISAVNLKQRGLEEYTEDIKVITAWPPKEEQEKVPSQLSYSVTPKGCEQYGYDIDDNSLVLKKTKIQLEAMGTRIDELRTLSELLKELRDLDLSQEEVIENGIPEHLAKEPEEIVKDYLDQIAEKTEKVINSDVGRHVLSNVPIDLVVTHPAIWSDRALNSTYRAVRAAFNHDLFPKLENISFVSEPVACAHFTLREAWKNNRVRFRNNDCFIVVDAGGGTVDLACYKVVTIDYDKKEMKLEQVGNPLGATCGSTCVDDDFETFAAYQLGDKAWTQLTTEGAKHAAGGHTIMRPTLRGIQEKFQVIKHSYDGKESGLTAPIYLPKSFAISEEMKGVSKGALSITPADLRKMFDRSVNKTLYLIQQAVTQIKMGEELPVKTIFLSGGFAQNKYLIQRIREFCTKQKISLEEGNGSWAAVARGAIIKSLGVYTEKPKYVLSSPRYYGIKVRRPFASYENHSRNDVDVDPQGIHWATDQIRWFIQKGDAIFPNKPTVAKYELHFSMSENDFPITHSQNKRGGRGAPQQPAAVFRDVVFLSSSRDRAPTSMSMVKEESEQMYTLRVNLTDVPQAHIVAIETGNKQQGKQLQFHVVVEIRVSEQVTVSIKSGETTLASRTIDLE